MRFTRFRYLALLLAVLLAPFAPGAPALRAETPAEEKKEHKAEQQGDFIDFKRYDLGLYTLVVFLALVFILRKFAWGPIMEGLDKREASIRLAHEEAGKARTDASSLREQLRLELQKAHDQARQIVDEARRDGQRTKDELVAAARPEIQAERERLLREIEQARDQALQEVWSQSVQLATLVSSKAIRRELSPDDHRRMVDEALAEMRPAGVQPRGLA